MQLTIIAVGGLREEYWLQAAREYEKRLSPYAKVRVREVAPVRVSNENSALLIQQALHREGAKIRRALPSGRFYLVALDVQGKSMTSEELAALLEQQAIYGCSHLVWLIGGSYGLEPGLLQQADLRLSFSAFTFPHQLMRVVLLEQLYRAVKIGRGEAYHK